MLEKISESAKDVGITVFITNSKEKIETQLNRLTGEEELPIMLVSWDIKTTLVFDTNGFLQNPKSRITALLLTKAEDTTKDELKSSASDMAKLFEAFIQKLYNNLIPVQRNNTTPSLESIEYQLVPKYGNGQHSGVLANWTMSTGVTICND